jgi:hypothetical protein
LPCTFSRDDCHFANFVDGGIYPFPYSLRAGFNTTAARWQNWIKLLIFREKLTH